LSRTQEKLIKELEDEGDRVFLSGSGEGIWEYLPNGVIGTEVGWETYIERFPDWKILDWEKEEREEWCRPVNENPGGKACEICSHDYTKVYHYVGSPCPKARTYWQMLMEGWAEDEVGEE